MSNIDILTGLSFGREKKQKKSEKVEVTDDDRKKFLEEGQAFGKELATKLSSEQGSVLIQVFTQI